MKAIKPKINLKQKIMLFIFERIPNWLLHWAMCEAYVRMRVKYQKEDLSWDEVFEGLDDD